MAECKCVLVGYIWVPSEAKGLVSLTQHNILVAGHEGTVTLPGDSGVVCYGELYNGQLFMKHPISLDKMHVKIQKSSNTNCTAYLHGVSVSCPMLHRFPF